MGRGEVEGEGQRGELDRWAMLRPMSLTFARGRTWSNGSLGRRVRLLWKGWCVLERYRCWRKHDMDPE